MIKQIINIILFIIYFFSFVSHNTIMAFSDINNHYTYHNISTDLTNLTHSNNHHQQPICSIIVDNNQNIQTQSDKFLLKSPDIKQTIYFDYYPFTLDISYFTQNIHILSPPFFNREIKNYNYATLIKIIKSNT